MRNFLKIETLERSRGCNRESQVISWLSKFRIGDIQMTGRGTSFPYFFFLVQGEEERREGSIFVSRTAAIHLAIIEISFSAN